MNTILMMTLLISVACTVYFFLVLYTNCTEVCQADSAPVKVKAGLTKTCVCVVNYKSLAKKNRKYVGLFWLFVFLAIISLAVQIAILK